MEFKILNTILSSEQSEIENMAKEFSEAEGYRLIKQDEIPCIIPKTLREKLSHIILMGERTANG